MKENPMPMIPEQKRIKIDQPFVKNNDAWCPRKMCQWAGDKTEGVWKETNNFMGDRILTCPYCGAPLQLR